MNTSKSLKSRNTHDFITKYKHGIPTLLYLAFYLVCFFYLERTVKTRFHRIQMTIDNKIPFLEIFVIPYLLWFAYVASTVIFCFFKDVKEYKKLCIYLFSGMTVFLLVSFLYPNGHYLRPVHFIHDNVFTFLVSILYKADTPTNLFPSIHVFNSIGCHVAITRANILKNNRYIKTASFILCVLIILSTVFIKQHSVFDVITGFGMALIIYLLVYQVNYNRAKSMASEKSIKDYEKVF